MGGALILPYWTAAGGNDSLITIRNDSDVATAAKVHWLGSDGERLLSYNLYLDARQVWTGAVAVIDGSVQLIGDNSSCQLSGDSPGSVGVTTDPRLLDAIRGSIEIIQVASTSEVSPLASAGVWLPCEQLRARFNDGVWSVDPQQGLLRPNQMMSASVSIISVGIGTMNSVSATALAGFSDMPQHSLPMSALPDLSSASDADAQEGQVRSLICERQGCRYDAWNRPIDAVDAALRTLYFIADFDL
ncbi:MAG: hypothetical protein AAGJ52_13765, partial [Pseudomonadota bacterium]